MNLFSGYTIPCVNRKTLGEYTCQASSPCGETISSTAVVSLSNAARGVDFFLLSASHYEGTQRDYLALTKDTCLDKATDRDKIHSTNHGHIAHAVFRVTPVQ